MSTHIRYHNVQTVEVENIVDHINDNGESFYTRCIIVKDDKGNRSEITLFADDKLTLYLFK